MSQSITIHPSSREYTLVVAVDFGTTRSGFVYCFLDDGAEEISSSNIHNFDNWGMVHNMNGIPSYAKDRTEILYYNGKAIDWGWGVYRPGNPEEGKLLRRFKLKLQHEEENFFEDGESYNIVNVVSDYLKLIRQSILDFIHGDIPFRISDNRILWCVTVPAIWNDIAVDRMKRSAVRAGYIRDDEKDTRLLLVREPEAAAVHCYLNSLNKTLQVGETFMVIDAGGGTIDLTSYRVSFNLKLEEIAKSSGGDDGSSFVDQNFFQYLAYLGLDIKKSHEDNKLLDLQMAWEQVKHAISSKELTYTVPIKNWKYFNENHEYFIKKLASDQDGNDEEIILTPTVVNQLFNPISEGPYSSFYPVFEGVRNDIDEHITALKRKGIQSVDNVFLVGGFNNSALLRNFIIDNFKYIVKDDTSKFIKPLRPEQAIMEGACIYAINPSIIHSRISKLTYGLSSLKEYDPYTHSGRPHRVYEGVDYCLDVFRIMCSKNQSIDYEESISAIYVPAEKDQKSMPVNIYCSDDEYPKYVTDSGVKKLASFEIGLPGHGLDRQVEVLFYFGKVDLRVTAKNLQTGETKNVSVRFSSSFG